MTAGSTRAWVVVGMLWLFLVVNFADKAIFGLAAIPIMRDMHLSNAQFGLLASSFYVLFAVTALTIGWLGDRLSTKWLIAALALVWTIAQFPVAASIGFVGFVACRILLGAGEGPSLSLALHEAYNWFPDRERPLITGIIESGLPSGAVVTALAGTWFIVSVGWRSAFVVLAAASFVWCLAWLLINRVPRRGENAIEAAGSVSGAPIPGSGRFWTATMVGSTIAAFATYWVSSLVVAWLPSFFSVAVGLSPSQTGTALTVAWLVQVPLFPFAGVISQALHGRSGSTYVARSAVASVGVALSGVAMIGLAGANHPWVAVLLATLCLSSTVVAVMAIPPMLGEIALAGRRSLTLGVCIGLASLGGIIAPLSFGAIVDGIGRAVMGYRLAFLCSGMVIILAAMLAHALMHPERDRERIRPAAARNVAV